MGIRDRLRHDRIGLIDTGMSSFKGWIRKVDVQIVLDKIKRGHAVEGKVSNITWFFWPNSGGMSLVARLSFVDLRKTPAEVAKGALKAEPSPSLDVKKEKDGDSSGRSFASKRQCDTEDETSRQSPPSEPPTKRRTIEKGRPFQLVSESVSKEKENNDSNPALTAEDLFISLDGITTDDQDEGIDQGDIETE